MPQGLPVAGQVLRLAHDADGCREVQHALETADEPARLRIAAELRGCAAQAARSPHANYVLQKCVEVLRPEAFDFIVQELLACPAPEVARHKCGCRVLQRIMEFGSPAQVAELLEALLPQVCELSLHPYGNYVVQHMLRHGEREQQQRALAALAEDARGLCCDPFGAAVLRAALASGVEPQQSALARGLARDTRLLLEMASSRTGHLAIPALASALAVPERRSLVQVLTTTAPSRCRYVRAVLRNLGLVPPKRAPRCEQRERCSESSDEQRAAAGGA